MLRKSSILIFIFAFTTSVVSFDAINLVFASNKQKKVLTYVAVGDSFTKGEGVLKHQTWSSLVTRKLQQTGIPIELVANPAKSGWTSKQLMDSQIEVVEQYQPDLVSVLIGLNDYAFEAVKLEDYEQNLNKIVVKLLAIVKNKAGVILITIPDFATTPYGVSYYKRFKKPDLVPKFNAVIKKVAAEFDLVVVDLFELSHKLNTQQYMFADKLHPSPLQHEYWADYFFPKFYLNAKSLL